MSAADSTALLPAIVITVTSVVVLILMSIKRNHFTSLFFTVMGIVVALLTLTLTDNVSPHQVYSLLIMDTYAMFFIGLILFTSLGVTFLGYSYLKIRREHCEEFYVVLLTATLGSIILVMADHFMTFFLGLELLTVSLYVMIAYLRSSSWGLEAGLKYLILAAASSAFLLFGMALIYAELGTMQFSQIVHALSTNVDVRPVFMLTGTALLLVGFGFKLAVVPFHMWTPDVYEGAPAPVTAFIATVSKGAVFALLLRYFIQADAYRYESAMLAVAVIAIASMFVGNFLALMQSNVKRILAYSSIAHLGYLLVAFVAGGQLAVEAVAYYFVVYFVTTLAAFGIIGLISRSGEEIVALDDYRGLFWSRPWISILFTAALLSLAGIPLTAGFIGKFLVLTAGIGSSRWVLVFALVVNSAIGLFYYIRVAARMYSKPAVEDEKKGMPVSAEGGVVLMVLFFAIIYFGVYPGPTVQLIRQAVSGLF